MSLNGTTLSMQGVTVRTFTCFRHFPIWMTSGMSEPAGTFESVNFPVALLTAAAIGPPE